MAEDYGGTIKEIAQEVALVTQEILSAFDSRRDAEGSKEAYQEALRAGEMDAFIAQYGVEEALKQAEGVTRADKRREVA